MVKKEMGAKYGPVEHPAPPAQRNTCKPRRRNGSACRCFLSYFAEALRRGAVAAGGENQLRQAQPLASEICRRRKIAAAGKHQGANGFGGALADDGRV